MINRIKLLPEFAVIRYFSFESSSFVQEEINYEDLKKQGQEAMDVLNKATKRRSEFGNRPANPNKSGPKVITANYRGKKMAGMRPVSFDEVTT